MIDTLLDAGMTFVVSLEPHPVVLRRLTDHLALNGLDWITPLPVAAGAERGSMTLRGYPPGHPDTGVSGLLFGATTAVEPDRRPRFTVDVHPLGRVPPSPAGTGETV